MIRRAFSSVGIKSFSTAEGIAELLQEASFINTQSTVERIPTRDALRHPAGGALQHCFTGLLLEALDFIKELAQALSEPQRSSRLSMIGEIGAALSESGQGYCPVNPMNLVRIRAQKPGGQPTGSETQP